MASFSRQSQHCLPSSIVSPSRVDPSAHPRCVLGATTRFAGIAEIARRALLVEERFDYLPHVDGVGALCPGSRSCGSGIEDSSYCSSARVPGGGGEVGCDVQNFRPVAYRYHPPPCSLLDLSTFSLDYLSGSDSQASP